MVFVTCRLARDESAQKLERGLRRVGWVTSWRIYFERGDWNGLGMVEELRFLWNATRGSRLRPWRSPYLRWRMETYSGKKADTLRLRDFWNVMWRDKSQFLRFLRWRGADTGDGTLN